MKIAAHKGRWQRGGSEGVRINGESKGTVQMGGAIKLMLKGRGGANMAVPKGRCQIKVA